jgi:hypothetical protein
MAFAGNPLTRITIGAGVEIAENTTPVYDLDQWVMRQKGEEVVLGDAFGPYSFVKYYQGQGSKTGTIKTS